MRKDAGFTLIELLVIIVIAGTLTAIAVPNFLTYQSNSRLKGALSTLRGDLVSARMLAIKRGFEYKVAFNSGGYLIQQGNLGSGSTSYTTEVTRNLNNEYTGVTVSASSDPVFSPKGTVTAAPVTITLQNGQKSQTITIYIAGKVKVN